MHAASMDCIPAITLQIRLGHVWLKVPQGFLLQEMLILTFDLTKRKFWMIYHLIEIGYIEMFHCVSLSTLFPTTVFMFENYNTYLKGGKSVIGFFLSCPYATTEDH